MIIAPFQGLFDGGFITRGCAPLYPGLSHFPPSGLRNQRPSFFVKAGNPWILKERMDSRIRWGDEGAGALRQAQGQGFSCGTTGGLYQVKKYRSTSLRCKI